MYCGSCQFYKTAKCPLKEQVNHYDDMCALIWLVTELQETVAELECDVRMLRLDRDELQDRLNAKL